MSPPSLLLLTLFCVTGGAAFAGAVTEPEDYWLGEANAPVPKTLRGGAVIDAQHLTELLKNSPVVVVDVSNAPHEPPQLAPGSPWLPAAHEAIPGALWIPGAGAGNLPDDVDDFFKARLAQATLGNWQVPVVTYCHAACWLSWNAAKRAMGYGYRRVYWFAGGVEGWRAAGFSTATTAPLGPGAEADASRLGAARPDAARPDAARPDAARPDAARPKIAVLDLELSGDLGGPQMTAEHDARLVTETLRLRHDLQQTGLYDVLDNTPARATVERLRAQQAYLHDCNGCDIDVGRELHADMTFVAWVNRVSGLILTLTYEVHDVATNQITARKSYDFRGDSDNTWNHAIDYMVRDIKTSMSANADTE